MPKTIKAKCTGCNKKLSIYVHKSFRDMNLLTHINHGADYLIVDKNVNGNTVKACEQHGIINVKDIKSIKKVKDKWNKDWNKSDKYGVAYD